MSGSRLTADVLGYTEAVQLKILTIVLVALVCSVIVYAIYKQTRLGAKWKSLEVILERVEQTHTQVGVTQEKVDRVEKYVNDRPEGSLTVSQEVAVVTRTVSELVHQVSLIAEGLRNLTSEGVRRLDEHEGRLQAAELLSQQAVVLAQQALATASKNALDLNGLGGKLRQLRAEVTQQTERTPDGNGG